MSLRIERLSGALGAEVHGVQLGAPLEPEHLEAIHDAWLEHLVLVFRDQTLSPAQLLDCARQFGEPTEYPFLDGVDGHPQVVEVLKRKHETINFGGVWHADTVYQDEPPIAALLYAVEVPPHGGDTIFANSYLAYERLSEGMKRLLEPLEVLNTSGKGKTAATRAPRLREDKAKPEATATLEAWHPAIAVHPETGRRALRVSPAHAVRFRDMSEEESEPLLAYLAAHQIRPELTCRLQWRPGSLALWDNRCTLHFPVNDYDGYERRMHRVSLASPRSSRERTVVES